MSRPGNGIAMRKKTVFAMVIGAMILLCAGYSSAAVLGTIGSNHAGCGMSWACDMFLSISYPLTVDRDSISLSWDVTLDDIGKTFFAFAGTHDNFDVFTYLLKNGINNGLFLSDNIFITFLLTKTKGDDYVARTACN